MRFRHVYHGLGTLRRKSFHEQNYCVVSKRISLLNFAQHEVSLDCKIKIKGCYYLNTYLFDISVSYTSYFVVIRRMTFHYFLETKMTSYILGFLILITRLISICV